MTATATVSDGLLTEFDNIVKGGEELPLEEIKKRYTESAWFQSYREHRIYDDIVCLPLTVDLILGDKGAVHNVVDGLKAIYGPDLMYVIEGTSGAAEFIVRRWKPEAALRAMWAEFAEHEYKTVLGAGAAVTR